MPQYNRPPTKKSKKPDEFISIIDHIVQFFIKNQTIFYLVCGAAVLGFGSYGLYQYFSARKVEKLASEYYQAENASGEEAVKLWEKIAHQAPSPLQEVAELQISGEYLKEKKFQQAADTFQKVGEEKSFLLSSLAQLTQGEALQSNGQYAEALAIYQSLSEKKGDPYQYHAKLGMARVMLAMGKDFEAKTILFELQEKGSDAPDMIKSAALQKLLALKLPTPP